MFLAKKRLLKYDFEGSVSNAGLGSLPGSTHQFYNWFQSCTSICSRFDIWKNDRFRRF